MKKYLGAGVAAAAVFTTLSFVAPSSAEAAYCEARSRFASGWGSGSLATAQRRALYECSIRTPRGYTCYITRCRY